MSAETALALNDDFLREVAGMASDEDAPKINSLPVLRINYDSDSIHPQGSWVVGQKKKDDAIVEEGEKVTGLIILAVRNRYAYYVESDTTKNCNSPMFQFGDTVRGSNYKHVCGKGCQYRAEGIDPRCQAQKVVFGIALTEGGGAIECISYMKGSGYMPLSDYVDGITKVKAGSKFVTVPTFTFLTMLGSEKKKNGAVVYWVPQFTKGPAMQIAQIREFEKKRQQVVQYIDSINSNISSEVEGQVSSPTVIHGAPTTSTVINATPPAFAPASSVEVETPPWEEQASVTAEPVDDIEAAIAKAMAGLNK